MKIGIDARMYGPTVGGGGLGRYVEQLVNELQKQNQHHRVVLFLKKENFEDCKILNPLFEKQLADFHWYGFAEQLLFPWLIKKSGVDFMHYPHWNIPLLSGTPFVVTIHDLILMEEQRSARVTTRSPIHFWIKYQGYRLAIAWALARSRAIIAVSNYTKDSIHRFFPKMATEKIRVIYEGLTHFSEETGTDSDEYAREKAYLFPTLHSPYILYIGNAYPHKNLDKLIEAFALVRESLPEVQLVLAGRDDIFYTRLKQQAQQEGFSQTDIIFVPTPNDETVRQLYRQAELYVFPSRAEGFGLPPLEAMSYGIPVVSSNRTSLPEILGNAALYFDPTQKEEMAGAIIRGLTNKPLREQLQKNGYLQIKKFTWETMVTKILDLYDILEA